MAEPRLVGAQTWFPVPSMLAGHLHEFQQSGRVPAPPRPAATVVLLRPTATGFEVYAQKRPATMAFAPNMYVFPGGLVDPRDAATRVGWVGPEPERWAALFGLAPSEAQAVICAAVREVFEECGVLLAGPDESTVVGDVSAGEWEQARIAMIGRELALGDVLAQRGLAVRADLLAPWARWVTPEFEPRRFDTYFFLARMPDGQRTRDVGGESEHGCWVSPAEGLTLPMLPPTALTLRWLACAGSIEAAIAAGAVRDLSIPVLPRLHVDGEATWLIFETHHEGAK